MQRRAAFSTQKNKVLKHEVIFFYKLTSKKFNIFIGNLMSFTLMLKVCAFMLPSIMAFTLMLKMYAFMLLSIIFYTA